MKKILTISVALLVFCNITLTAEVTDKFQPAIGGKIVNDLDAAVAKRRGGHYDEAIRGIQIIVSQVPNYYRAHYNLALAYADSGNFVEASKYFSSALEIRERERVTDLSIYNSMGWAKLLEGKPADAKKHFDIAEKNFDSLNGATKNKLMNNIGTMYLSVGEPEKAIDYFERAEALGNTTAGKNAKISQSIMQINK